MLRSLLIFVALVAAYAVGSYWALFVAGDVFGFSGLGVSFPILFLPTILVCSRNEEWRISLTEAFGLPDGGPLDEFPAVVVFNAVLYVSLAYAVWIAWPRVRWLAGRVRGLSAVRNGKAP